MTAQEIQTLRANARQNKIDAEVARDRAHKTLEYAETHLTRCRHLEHLLNMAKIETPTPPAPTMRPIEAHSMTEGLVFAALTLNEPPADSPEYAQANAHFIAARSALIAHLCPQQEEAPTP